MQTHVANMWTSKAEFNTTHLPFQIKCVKEKKSMQSPYKWEQSYQQILFMTVQLFPNPVDIIY